MFIQKQIQEQYNILKQLQDWLDNKEKAIITHSLSLISDVLNTHDKTALQNYAEELYFLFEKNEKKCILLDCAIDSIAIANRYAYEKAEQIYFPEPIALVFDETLGHLQESLKTFK